MCFNLIIKIRQQITVKIFLRFTTMALEQVIAALLAMRCYMTFFWSFSNIQTIN